MFPYLHNICPWSGKYARKTWYNRRSGQHFPLFQTSIFFHWYFRQFMCSRVCPENHFCDPSPSILPPEGHNIPSATWYGSFIPDLISISFYTPKGTMHGVLRDASWFWDKLSIICPWSVSYPGYITPFRHSSQKPFERHAPDSEWWTDRVRNHIIKHSGKTTLNTDYKKQISVNAGFHCRSIILLSWNQ